MVALQSVGVQGDFRSYKYLSVLNGNGLDVDWQEAHAIAKVVPNHTNCVNRMAYILNKNKDITKGIHVYPMYMNKQDLDLLREIDHLVTGTIQNKVISQTFAVLLPIGITGKKSVAIRCIVTNDFMTGRPAIVGKDIAPEEMQHIVAQIEANYPEIDLVLYDVTGKPPATVEWQ